MRELPSSSHEARNHPKECDPQRRFPIHLAKSRLQLFAIARSAGPALIILPTTTSSGRRYVGTSQDVIDTLLSNRAARCQAQISVRNSAYSQETNSRNFNAVCRSPLAAIRTSQKPAVSGCVVSATFCCLNGLIENVNLD